MSIVHHSPSVRNILITGASSGIGMAVAIRLAELGAEHIYFCGRNPERVSETQRRLSGVSKWKGESHPQILDVCDKESVREWIRSCDAATPLDLVWANAGISTGGREDDENAVRAVFDCNVTGVLNTVYPAIERYRMKSVSRVAKRIAITSSLTGYHGLPQCPAYSASKAAVKALGAALRGRLKREGISVTTFCPGFVRSRITDQNTCPMPFFWEAEDAARLMCRGILHGKGLVTFPWQMRFGMWLLASMPEVLSEKLFSGLPEKTAD